MSPKADQHSYGVLNPISKPTISKKVALDDSAPADLVKRAVLTDYTPNSLQRTNRFRAIVLRVESNTKQEAGHWSDKVFNFFGGNSVNGTDQNPVFVKIKARIPEIHASLPAPKTYGDNNEDQATIDMYPTFVGKDTSIKEPKPGDIVYVSFANPNNMTDPIYLGPLVQNESLPGGGGTPSGRGAHGNCTGRMSVKKPQGKEIVGSNKPLSHSGLPLLRRTTKTRVSKEHKTLRGIKHSNVTVKKWEKSIKTYGAPGISWLGVMPSNGLEDKGHKSGKRETLIYAPNAIDYGSVIELIYMFHGSKEFGSKFDFKRYAKQTKKMIEAKRNFILVVPELPWGINQKKTKLAWVERDDFSIFHKEVTNTIVNFFSKSAKLEFVSFIAYNRGCNAVKQIINRGAAEVNPKRIILAECEKDILPAIWNKYVNGNKNVKLSIITKSGGSPFMAAKDFKNTTPQSKEAVDFEVLDGKTSRDVADFAMSYESSSDKAKTDRELKKAIDEQNKKAATDETAGKAEEEKIEEAINSDVTPKSESSAEPHSSNAPVSHSAKEKKKVKKGAKNAKIAGAVPFEEARVRVKDFGAILDVNDKRLVPVSGTRRGIKLHVLAAKRFSALQEAWLRENPGASPMKICSGHRLKRWRDWEHFESFAIRNYGTVKEARKWIAWESPHNTGLAFDICNNGLFPARKTAAKQVQTRLYKWLVKNAHRFGVTPYKTEPWHWECRVPKESFDTGEEFTDNLAVRVDRVGGSGANVPRLGVPPSEGCVTTIKETS